MIKIKNLVRHDIYLTVKQGNFFKVRGTHSGLGKSAEIRGALDEYIENNKEEVLKW